MSRWTKEILLNDYSLLRMVFSRYIWIVFVLAGVLSCLLINSLLVPIPTLPSPEWTTLISLDPSRYCALIGWDHDAPEPALLCHCDQKLAHP